MANKSKQRVWGVRKEGRTLWTRNAVKGVSVRGERRKRDGRIEWRRWDPTRSKVAAAILRTRVEPSSLLPTPGSTCLYLGASSGGTVSHIHDFVCGADNHHGGQLVEEMRILNYAEAPIVRCWKIWEPTGELIQETYFSDYREVNSSLRRRRISIHRPKEKTRIGIKTIKPQIGGKINDQKFDFDRFPK